MIAIRPRTALILGIQYLAFQAFPVIFQEGHGFNVQSTGMSFLGIGLGMVLAISTQPFWNKYAVQTYHRAHSTDVSLLQSDYLQMKQRDMVVMRLLKYV